MKIHTFDAAAARAARTQLVELLLDAVAGGAALGFQQGLDRDAAAAYWDGVVDALERGTRLLLAAVHEGRLLGSVQLDLCQQKNGQRFAELQQMMVHRAARRRGLGGVLLRAAEAEAGALGRMLLFLDAEAGSCAEQLYHGYGYTRVWTAEAEAPHLGQAATSTYYKSLLPVVAA
jgi:acetyltransferase